MARDDVAEGRRREGVANRPPRRRTRRSPGARWPPIRASSSRTSFQRRSRTSMSSSGGRRTSSASLARERLAYSVSRTSRAYIGSVLPELPLPALRAEDRGARRRRPRPPATRFGVSASRGRRTQVFKASGFLVFRWSSSPSLGTGWSTGHPRRGGVHDEAHHCHSRNRRRDGRFRTKRCRISRSRARTRA